MCAVIELKNGTNINITALMGHESLKDRFLSTRLIKATLRATELSDNHHCILDILSNSNPIGGWLSELNCEKVCHLTEVAQENYDLGELDDGNALHRRNHSVFMNLLNTADSYGVYADPDGFDRSTDGANQQEALAYIRRQCDAQAVALMHLNGINLAQSGKGYYVVDVDLLDNFEATISVMKFDITHS